MKRREFFQAAGAAALAAGVSGRAQAFVPSHAWERHDFGPPPPVKDRLYQGPFPQYPPEELVPGSDVVMTTLPAPGPVSNPGMGLTVYLSGDYWPPRTGGASVERYCEDLIRLPFVQKAYLRLTWRDLQKAPGRLDLPEGWKAAFALARQYGKGLGLRVMLENPDSPEPGLPAFLEAKVPTVELKGTWKRDTPEPRRKPLNAMPRYDHPAYQAAFRELNELLARELDGNPLVEYLDTFMYGFWGEGHTWPYEGNPFPDATTAEATWIRMLAVQQACFPRTPLATNTQPDFSRVGNSELVDRSVRNHDWLRTDTIFIENEQIEALANRPPWVAAICEAGMMGDPEDPGFPARTANTLSHVLDVGANYWSLWNFHAISAERLGRSRARCEAAFDLAARRIGYRVRPSWIWAFEKDGRQGLVLGMVNDGVACVPGVLRLTLQDAAGQALASGCLDAGCPATRGVRQASLLLPPGVPWPGLRLRADLEVKGRRLPVAFACAEAERDGSLILGRTPGL